MSDVVNSVCDRYMSMSTLAMVSEWNRKELCQFLLSIGANPNQRDQQGLCHIILPIK